MARYYDPAAGQFTSAATRTRARRPTRSRKITTPTPTTTQSIALIRAARELEEEIEVSGLSAALTTFSFYAVQAIALIR